MVTVGGVDHAGVVGPQVFSGQQTRAVGEDDVVFRKAFLCHGRGRDDENRARAEAEEKHRTVTVGEFG